MYKKIPELNTFAELQLAASVHHRQVPDMMTGYRQLHPVAVHGNLGLDA